MTDDRAGRRSAENFRGVPSCIAIALLDQCASDIDLLAIAQHEPLQPQGESGHTPNPLAARDHFGDGTNDACAGRRRHATPIMRSEASRPLKASPTWAVFVESSDDSATVSCVPAGTIIRVTAGLMDAVRVGAVAAALEGLAATLAAVAFFAAACSASRRAWSCSSCS